MDNLEEKITDTTQVILEYLSPNLASVFMARLIVSLPDGMLKGELLDHFNKVHAELHLEHDQFAQRKA